MSSNLTLSPVLGFNSEFRLHYSKVPSTILTKDEIKERLFILNGMNALGCLPLVGVIVGIFRIYCAQKTLDEIKNKDSVHFTNAAQHTEARALAKNFMILGIAEITLGLFYLNPLLMVVHLTATIFDHTIAVSYFISDTYTKLTKQN